MMMEPYLSQLFLERVIPDLIPLGVPIVGDLVDVSEFLTSVVLELTMAALTAISDVFTGLLTELLMVEPPKDNSGSGYAIKAAELREKSITIFPYLLSVVFLVGIVSSPAADQSKANKWILLQRLAKVIVFTMIFYTIFTPALNFVNAVSSYFIPETYSIMLGPDMKDDLLGMTGGSLLSVLIIIMMLMVVGVPVLIAFTFALILRAFIIYLVWGSYPILLCMWYLNFGPLSFVSKLSSVLLSAAGILIMLGPVIALGMGLGGA